MKNDKSKKVTYTIKTGDELELSREVEHTNRPRININIDGDDLLTVLAFATVWFLLFLMFVGMR